VLYTLLKWYAQLAIKIYCRKILVNKPAYLQADGPLLLAANHPNSFLDGMILTTLFQQPVYSLARGDAFKNKWVNRFLRQLQLLPVYRTSEGVENLEHNYTTFSACLDVFANNGIVLIFSEGRCENEWHLRPLKKGTARLSTTAWNNNIPLQVLPVGFNYNSFKSFGKDVHLLFGESFGAEAIDLSATEGKQWLQFNELLNGQLERLVYEIDEDDTRKRNALFPREKGLVYYLLLVPALVGFILHAPLFFVCKMITHLRFRNSGHYDSVLTSLLLILYPFYFLAVVLLCCTASAFCGISAIVLLPFTAWACVQVK
jgi:1-acyl-sn-glycerol-3-phosphate acyltransferase